MEESKYVRTPQEEKELHDAITVRVRDLERSNYKKKRFDKTQMVKQIKKIIEEEVERR